MPRYVVLHHRCFPGVTDETLPRGTQDHFDWMFENGDSLLTWATDVLPSKTTPSSVPALQLPDHRTHYLTFQGSLSGGRGEVERVEEGNFERVRSDETHHEFAVSGGRLGTVLLQKIQRGGDTTWDWSFLPRRADAS